MRTTEVRQLLDAENQSPPTHPDCATRAASTTEWCWRPCTTPATGPRARRQGRAAATTADDSRCARPALTVLAAHPKTPARLGPVAVRRPMSLRDAHPGDQVQLQMP